jgi:hypothetical protein
MIAGQRRPRVERSEVVHIDYAEVMRQAVANERARVIREIRTRVERIAVDVYGRRPMTGDDVKRTVLGLIQDQEAGNA